MAHQGVSVYIWLYRRKTKYIHTRNPLERSNETHIHLHTRVWMTRELTHAQNVILLVINGMEIQRQTHTHN